MGEVKPLKRRSQVFDMHFMTENIDPVPKDFVNFLAK